MLAANDTHEAELHRTSEDVGSYVMTSGVVAEIFGEHFFAPVWSLEAGLDRYLRNGESPKPSTCINYLMPRGPFCK